MLINAFNSCGNEAIHHKEKRMIIIHNKLQPARTILTLIENNAVMPTVSCLGRLAPEI